MASSTRDQLPQREARDADRTSVRPAPAAVFAALQAPGQPLPADLQAILQPTIGVDLGRVRVHTDARANAAAEAVDADAFAAGRHIVFRAGQWAPRRAAGRVLLRHELAHVDEQRAAELPATPLTIVDDPRAERAAHAARHDIRGAARAVCVQRSPRVAASELQAALAPRLVEEQAAITREKLAAEARELQRVSEALGPLLAHRDAHAILVVLRTLAPGQLQELSKLLPLRNRLGAWMGLANQIAAHSLLAGLPGEGSHCELAERLIGGQLRRAWELVRDLDPGARAAMYARYNLAFGWVAPTARTGYSERPLLDHLERARTPQVRLTAGTKGTVVGPYAETDRLTAAIAVALDSPQWQPDSAIDLFCLLYAGEPLSAVQLIERIGRTPKIYETLLKLQSDWRTRLVEAQGWRFPELASLRGEARPLRQALESPLLLSDDQRTVIAGVWVLYDREQATRTQPTRSLADELRDLADLLARPSTNAVSLRRRLEQTPRARRVALYDSYAAAHGRAPIEEFAAQQNSRLVALGADVMTVLGLLADLPAATPALRLGWALHHFIDDQLAIDTLLQVRDEVGRIHLRVDYQRAFGGLVSTPPHERIEAVYDHIRYRLMDGRWPRATILATHAPAAAEKVHLALIEGAPLDALKLVHDTLRAGVDALDLLSEGWETRVQAPLARGLDPLSTQTLWQALQTGLGPRFAYLERIRRRVRAESDAKGPAARSSAAIRMLIGDLEFAYQSEVGLVVLEDLAEDLGRRLADNPEAGELDRVALGILSHWSDPARSRCTDLIGGAERAGLDARATLTEPAFYPSSGDLAVLLRQVTAAWATGSVDAIRFAQRGTLRTRRGDIPLHETLYDAVSRARAYTVEERVRAISGVAPKTRFRLRQLAIMFSGKSRGEVAFERLYLDLFDAAFTTSPDERLASAREFVKALQPGDIDAALPPLDAKLAEFDDKARPGDVKERIVWSIRVHYPDASRDRLAIEWAIQGPPANAQDATLRAGAALASGRQSRLTYGVARALETPGAGPAPHRVAEYQLGVLGELAGAEQHDPEAVRDALIKYGYKDIAGLSKELLAQISRTLDMAAASRVKIGEFVGVITEALLRGAIGMFLGPVGVGGLLTAWLATTGGIAVREALLGVDYDAYSANNRVLLVADIPRMVFAGGAVEERIRQALAAIGDLRISAPAAETIREFTKFAALESFEALFERLVGDQRSISDTRVALKLVSGGVQGVLAGLDKRLFDNANNITAFGDVLETRTRQILNNWAYGPPTKASLTRTIANECINAVEGNYSLTSDTFLDAIGTAAWKSLLFAVTTGAGTEAYRRWEGQKGRSKLAGNLTPLDAKLAAVSTGPLAKFLLRNRTNDEPIPNPTSYIAAGIARGEKKFTDIAGPFQRFLADQYFGGADPWALRGVRQVTGAGRDDAAPVISSRVATPPPARSDAPTDAPGLLGRALASGDRVVTGRPPRVPPPDVTGTLPPASRSTTVPNDRTRPAPVVRRKVPPGDE